RGVGRLAAADAVDVDVDPGLGDVVEADVHEVVAVVAHDVQVDVGMGEDVGRLAIRLDGVEGEVVLPRAEVRPHVQAPPDERAPCDVGAGSAAGAADGPRWTP